MNTCDKPLSGRTIGEAADCAGQAISGMFQSIQTVLHSPATATLGDWGTAIALGIPIFLAGAFLVGIVVGVVIAGPMLIFAALPKWLTSPIDQMFKFLADNMQALALPIVFLTVGLASTAGVLERPTAFGVILSLTITFVSAVWLALVVIGRRKSA